MKFASLGLALISTILFGVIDGFLFMFVEEYVQTELVKIPFFDVNMAELAAGGISTSVAIFVAFYVHDIIEEHYHIIDHPILDALGVIIGTIIVLTIYFLYKTYYKSVEGEVKDFINHFRIKKIKEEFVRSKIEENNTDKIADVN